MGAVYKGVPIPEHESFCNGLAVALVTYVEVGPIKFHERMTATYDLLRNELEKRVAAAGKTSQRKSVVEPLSIPQHEAFCAGMLAGLCLHPTAPATLGDQLGGRLWEAYNAARGYLQERKDDVAREAA